MAEPGDLVLKVAYVGICGSDLHATEPGPLPLPAGVVLGHEFAGEVAESASPDWRVGDRVIGVPLRECDECRPLGECRDKLGILCGRNRIIGLSTEAPGAYAEYVQLGAKQALRVPEGVGLKEAALTEPLAVGAHAVRIAGSLYGARVLVVGAGPIGLAVTAFARFAGARAVAVSEIDPTRRERAVHVGATALLDPSAEEIGPGFARAAGGPPDVIFECVGAPGLAARLHGAGADPRTNRGGRGQSRRGHDPAARRHPQGATRSASRSATRARISRSCSICSPRAGSTPASSSRR